MELLRTRYTLSILRDLKYMEGSLMCRHRKSLYELKQTLRAWYSRINGYLMSMGFTKSEADPNFYFILVGDDPLILVLYVDNIFLTGAEKLISM
jgi:hypothetical protein